MCSLSTGSPSCDSSPVIIAAYTLSVAGAIRPLCAVFHSTTTPSYLSLHSSSSDLQPQGSAASSLTSHFVIAWSIMSATSPRGTLQRGSRSEEHTSELQSRGHLVCRLLLEKKH